MRQNLPSLVLTGASGFIGRHFLQAAREHYRIYAIARRPQLESGVPNHANVHWIQVDIADWSALKRVMGNIKRQGGADFMVHLAAFYDLTLNDSGEYLRTNINGTRHMLEQAKWLCVKRFIFASSLVACQFPGRGQAVDEDTPADAEFPYAHSKRVGEQLVEEYSRWFPCSIIRLAAVFSDWCEYAPLYVFLSTWLSNRWNARILGGHGLSAVPYIHARDVERLFLTILHNSTELPAFAIYVGSPTGATSHRDLFELATRFYYGRSRTPIYIPKSIAWVGVAARTVLGRLTGKRPFEQLWMLKYLDTPLSTNSDRTQAALGWSTTPRLEILRRLLFLVEKMKSHDREWMQRNETAMTRPRPRPALVIHDSMMLAKDAIVDAISAFVRSPVREDRFRAYSRLSADDLRSSVGVIYELLMAAVRTADRTLLLDYIQDFSLRQFACGVSQSELCDLLFAVSEITVEQLLFRPDVSPFETELVDSVTLPIALAIDGVQDAHDAFLESQNRGDRLAEQPARERHLAEIVDKLNAFYRPLREEEEEEEDSRDA